MAARDDQNDAAQPVRLSPDASDETRSRTQGSYVGITLNNRYLIEKELGRGGIGVVYLARDHQLLFKPVVIKVLLDPLGEPDDYNWFKRKFRQEIEALARIDHPGIVGVFDTGEMPDGKPYFVMQFVEGYNLRSITSVGGLDLTRIAHIMRQIGQALSAAHDRGICHRDLKPDNIMLQSLGEGEEYVKLIDFGLAMVKDSQVAASDETSKVAGTVAYMAPEQLMGKPSAASDIYALGVIAYEMVTGRRPFKPDTQFQLLEMQREGVRVKPSALRPSLPEAAEEVILRALSFEPTDRPQRARDFGEELARVLTTGARSLTHSPPPVAETIALLTTEQNLALRQMRVALLYKRNAQPDEQVLKLLQTQFLAHGHEVFIDRHLTIGVEWAREIERQVRTSDAVIPLLSRASILSEMMTYEVQIAHEATQQQGKPCLLPVRVGFEGSLPDPLASILDPIQHALWSGPEDDQSLVKELLAALWRTPSPPRPTILPRKMEPVGGAVPLDSQFYIVRPTDEEFSSAIERHDSIVLVKGARQMGKTSLLARGLQQAREEGAKVVLTDFQVLNAAHLESINTLLLTLAEMIADQLDLDVLPEQTWNTHRGPSMNFGRYLRREVLGKLSCPLVWGLDEVDRLFACDYGSEVFGLFRSWHNARSLDPQGPWRLLTLAIAYATEAHLFITDVNQSPFNVGTRLVLDDFTLEQVAELNRRYGSPIKGTAEVARYYRLVSGHPYLVRKGLHEMASHGTGLAAFEAVVDRDEGPFGDHLRRILVSLAQDPTLCDVVRGVLRGQPCPTMESFYRLRSAGVMSGDSARDARPRCQLYATYLERHLL